MQYRVLGSTGMKVSNFCLGTLDYGLRVEPQNAVELISAAYDMGVNFIDTACSYPKNDRGRAEKCIGEAMKGRRHQFVVGTKVYGPCDDATGPNDKGLSRKHIIKTVDASLKNLKTDYIDIVYLHHPDPDTPLEETLGVLTDLIHAGKIRYIGCSNYTTWQIAEALALAEKHNYAKFVCVEPPYNVLARDIEIELLPYCKYKGIGVAAYSPMASELLSGQFTMNGPKTGRFADAVYGGFSASNYWNEDNFKAIERLKKCAADLGITLPQFALAFVMNRVTSAISGPINIEQLTENIKACDIVLPKEALEACDDVWEIFRTPRKYYAQDGDGRAEVGRWGWERSEKWPWEV